MRNVIRNSLADLGVRVSELNAVHWGLCLDRIVERITDEQCWGIFRAYDKAETDAGGYAEMRAKIRAALAGEDPEPSDRSAG